MPVHFETEEGNLVIFRVSGELGKAELDRVLDKCENVIKKNSPVKLLVITEDFTGWERAEGWEDTSFADRVDPYIKKMAIVCEEKWQDYMHLFTLKGHRPFDIKFFKPTQEKTARLWLDIS